MGIKNKTSRGIKICLIILITSFLIREEVFSQNVGVNQLNPQEVLKKAIDGMYPPNVVYKGEMTIKRPNKEHKKKMKIYLKGKDNRLVEFFYPPKEEGLKILGKAEMSWMYLPSVEKIIRLSGKTSVVGGDFLYEDILRVRLDEDYNPISIKEEDDRYILELIAKTKNAPYEKILYFVDKKTYLPQEAQFFVLQNRCLKTLIYKEPKLMKGRLMPTVLMMQQAFTKDYETIIKIEEVDFKSIPDRIFTQEYLKKGI